MVVRVADINRPRPIGCNRGAVRPVERGGVRGTAIAVASPAAVAGEGEDHSGADVDPADRVVLGVDDQQVTLAIDGELLRRVESRGDGRTVVAGIGLDTGA